MAQAPKKKSKWDSKHERGVVYFSHLPHGFYEKELRGFLSQFGTITNLRVGRSSRTGRCKGYAFVEFLYMDVAKIVAETMNNYLMFEKLVKCQLVPAEKVSRAMFRQKININRPPLLVRRFKAKRIVNSTRSEKQVERRLQRQNSNLSKVQSKLQKYGIDLVIPDQRKDEGVKKTPSMKEDKKKKSKKCATPVMEVDESDLDISMKTPPAVKKIKSRSNSTVNSAVNSAANTPKNTPKATKLNKAVAEKLNTKVLKVNSSKKSPSNRRPLMSKKIK